MWIKSRFNTWQTFKSVIKMVSHIKLYGGKATRFEEIKDQLENDLGYKPSNPEVTGMLMSMYGTDGRSSTSGPLKL